MKNVRIWINREDTSRYKAASRIHTEEHVGVEESFKTDNSIMISKPGTEQACLLQEDYLFRAFQVHEREVYIFGAGHVGYELAFILSRLPFKVHIIDQRWDTLSYRTVADIPIQWCDDPRKQIDTAPPYALYLIMTHNHDLDYELCRRILLREDFSFLGLIGSQTKAAPIYIKIE